MKHIARKLLLGVALAMVGLQAQAIQISGVGDTWTVDWLVTSTTSDLTATSNWVRIPAKLNTDSGRT